MSLDTILSQLLKKYPSDANPAPPTPKSGKATAQKKVPPKPPPAGASATEVPKLKTLLAELNEVRSRFRNTPASEITPDIAAYYYNEITRARDKYNHYRKRQFDPNNEYTKSINKMDKVAMGSLAVLNRKRTARINAISKLTDPEIINKKRLEIEAIDRAILLETQKRMQQSI